MVAYDETIFDIEFNLSRVIISTKKYLEAKVYSKFISKFKLPFEGKYMSLYYFFKL